MKNFDWNGFNRELNRTKEWQQLSGSARDLRNVMGKMGADIQREAKPLGDMWQHDTAPVRWAFSPVTNLVDYWRRCGKHMTRTRHARYIMFDISRMFGGRRRLF